MWNPYLLTLKAYRVWIFRLCLFPSKIIVLSVMRNEYPYD